MATYIMKCMNYYFKLSLMSATQAICFVFILNIHIRMFISCPLNIWELPATRIDRLRSVVILKRCFRLCYAYDTSCLTYRFHCAFVKQVSGGFDQTSMIRKMT